MKAKFRIKYRNEDTNEMQSIEYFHYKNGYALHHHLLTTNQDNAKIYPVVRKIGQLFYCTQEFALTNDQWKDLEDEIISFRSQNTDLNSDIKIKAAPVYVFENFSEWVNRATIVFENKNHSCFICIDSMGYICNTGEDFMQARDKGRFPVKAYLLLRSKNF